MIKTFDIYCDFDGVLVDFRRGSREVLGKNFEDPHWGDLNKEDKYDIIRNHPDFWERLPPMKDMRILWGFIKIFNPCALTAYAEWDKHDSIDGKWKWNQKYLGIAKDRFHCVAREDKQKYAVNENGKPNVLIDDYRLNISEWEKAGGIGVHHVDALNTIQRLRNLGFSE